MTIRKIEYCHSNLQFNGTRLVFDTIKQNYPQIDQVPWSCLGNCSECFKKPFVLINKQEFLYGDTPEELLNQLLNKASFEA